MNLEYLAYLARLGVSNLHPGGALATARLLAALDLRAGQRVLDIGCGTGMTLVQIAAAYSVTLDAIDALPEMLHVARLRLRLAGVAGRVALVLGRVGAPLPFPDQTYDRAYTESVLGFQDARVARQMLGEIWRVLKPGGLYVANEAIWQQGVAEAVVAAINQSCIADFGVRQASEQAWALDDWLRLMHEVGFRVIAAAPWPLPDGGPLPPAPRRAAPRLILSRLLTLYYRLAGRVTPRMARRRVHYQRALQRHHQDGQYIESRLFILQKP